MSLVPNFAVTTVAQKVLTGRAGVRGIVFTNNNVGAGQVYFQLVDKGFSSNLTTANGTLIPSQPNPYTQILTPGYQAGPFNLTPNNDDSDGFDLYLISNSTAQVSVQTVPF